MDVQDYIMHIQRLGFIAFPVADLKRSNDFYVLAIGLCVLNTGMFDIDFDFAGVRLRVYTVDSACDRQHSGLQFFVDDVDAAYRELEAKGVDLRSGVRDEIWGGRVFTVADPDGNLFDLVDAAFEKNLV